MSYQQMSNPPSSNPKKVSFNSSPVSVDSPSTRNPLKVQTTPSSTKRSKQPSFMTSMQKEAAAKLIYEANNPPKRSSSSSGEKDENEHSAPAPRRLKKNDKNSPPPRHDARFSFHDSHKDQVEVEMQISRRNVRDSRDIINLIDINSGSDNVVGSGGAGGVNGGFRPRASNMPVGGTAGAKARNSVPQMEGPIPSVDQILKTTDDYVKQSEEERRIPWEDAPVINDNPVKVYMAIELSKISSVDPIHSTCQVDMNIDLVWNDHRLLNLMKGDSLDENDLPKNLWRPSFDLLQKGKDIPLERLAYYDFQVEEVEVINPKGAVLQVTIRVSGTIYDPHDLRCFPFDENIIEMTFVGNITRDGRHADAQDYVLIPFNSQVKNELNISFNFLTAYKEVVDSLPDFFIVGTTLSSYVKSTKHLKQEYSYINFGIVLRRNYFFYFSKIMLLLWMVAFLFTSIFSFKTCDFESRTGMINTMFLATAAALYTISGKLPAVGFLTPIDQLVVMTLAVVFCVSAENRVLTHLCKSGDDEFASVVDDVFFYALIGGYVLGNVIIFGPHMYSHFKAKHSTLVPLKKGEKFKKWVDVPDVNLESLKIV